MGIAENINTQNPDSLKTQALDHLGLVAAITRDLGMIDKINQRLPTTDKANVTMGQRVLALILNGLGFTNDRLYLVPRFFQNKPVDRLIGPGIEAEHLNDDALGRCLDAIANYGTTRLFGELAFEIGEEQGLLGKSSHLDTTSLTLQGDYQEAGTATISNQDETQSESHLVNSTPRMLQGYSKDHRPDLKQVVLSMTTTGPASFPFWMEALDGNSSDKISFHETIAKVKAFQKQLEEASPMIWVADSALYTVEKLLNLSANDWITRVPNTIGAAKALCEAPSAQFEWTDIGNGYHLVVLGSNYGGLRQRWLMIHSQQAFERESATFEQQLTKKEEQLNKAIWHLGNQVFVSVDSAEKAIEALSNTAKYHDLDYSLQEVRKYSGKGRPKAGQEPTRVEYIVKAHFSRNQSAIATARNAKGRFILATNQLDSEQLSDLEVFHEYKEQSQVEGGFRFLKDPWFMLDSVFLKNPARIGALMMVMTLCLMVYNVGQFRLREILKENEETLPNQVGKPTKNPTLRWVFRLMEGISVVHLVWKGTKEKAPILISNLDEVKRKIIHYFGQYALEIYGLT